ncbi:MAG TPA: SRPBCC family protein [Solirubrobacteraceae bacterium]|nr:SRPBCC family protein [Solirubrobacteraceae bacterium]
MAVHRLERRQFVARPVDEVFSFFAEAGNLERITPPWLSFRVLTPDPVRMAVGTLIDYRLRLHGIPLGWTSQIEVWEADSPTPQFVDRAIRGPFSLWHHRHRFAASGEGTIVSDEVHYAPPLGALGEIADQLIVARDLDQIFAHRQQAVAEILEGAHP